MGNPDDIVFICNCIIEEDVIFYNIKNTACVKLHRR